MLSVDFKSPISFEILIDRIEEVSTVDGKRVWLEGMGYFGEHDEQTGFYCPEELEYILRDISIKKGDKILIMYLGFSRKGGRKKEFYVRPSEREEEEISNASIEDDPPLRVEITPEEDPPIEIVELSNTSDTITEVPDEYEEEIDFDKIMEEIEEEE